MTQTPKKLSFKFYQSYVGLTLFFFTGLLLLSLLFSLPFIFSFLLSILMAGFVFVPLFLFYSRRQVSAEMAHQELKEEHNLLVADLHHQDILLKSYQRKIKDADRLKDLTEQLCQSFTVKEVADLLTQEVYDLFAKKEAHVFLYSYDFDLHLKCISIKGKEDFSPEVFEKADVFETWVIKNRTALLVPDVNSDYRFDTNLLNKNISFQSLMITPLISGPNILGFIRVESSQSKSFQTTDLRLFSAVGDLGVIGLENARIYDRLNEIAMTDVLTGLYQRRYLEASLKECEMEKNSAVLMIDIDHFKKYNDEYGHIAGDLLLKKFAVMLKDYFSSMGIVARYGGEEFCVVIKNIEREGLRKLVEDFRKNVEQAIFELRRRETKITISIGVIFQPGDLNAEEILKRADQALYQAKENGRNQAVFL